MARRHDAAAKNGMPQARGCACSPRLRINPVLKRPDSRS
ncbi:hypothetical protein I552_1665 [Mycobacterium xenopi 3993]|nr:hypothetical protein I552_1665 [Mycobacterium xenopi 3993]